MFPNVLLAMQVYVYVKCCGVTSFIVATCMTSYSCVYFFKDSLFVEFCLHYRNDVESFACYMNGFYNISSKGLMRLTYCLVESCYHHYSCTTLSLVKNLVQKEKVPYIRVCKAGLN